MIGALSFVVVVLAAYRATRIVTTDSLTERFREALYRWAWVESDETEAYASSWLRWNAPAPLVAGAALPRRGGFRTYVSELFQCPWCLGVWVSYAITAAWWWGVRDGGSVFVFVIVGLAVAGGQGFMASRVDA